MGPLLSSREGEFLATLSIESRSPGRSENRVRRVESNLGGADGPSRSSRDSAGALLPDRLSHFLTSERPTMKSIFTLGARSWLARSVLSVGCVSWACQAPAWGQDGSSPQLESQVPETMQTQSADGGDGPSSIFDCPPADSLNAFLTPLSSIRVSVTPSSGNLPNDCTKTLFKEEAAVAGLEANTQFHWQPTNFFHQPLYFDDQPLERYGQTAHPLIQPVVSGAKFFGTFPIVPYKMGFNGTHDCVTPMGYYRPGSCAPCVRELYPFTWKGALLEAGVASGMVFGLP